MAKHKREEMEHKEHKEYRPMKNRSCTDVLCLLLFLVFIGGWVAVSVIAFSQGNPELIVFPSNSSGFVCGRRENENKPHVLFHDITKCLSLTSAFGCPTPQVCVEKCPDSTSSLYACLKVPGSCTDLVEEYRQFCVPMTDAEWNTAKQDPDTLISTRKCPPYTLSSKSIIGRCVPDFGLISDSTSNETNISDGNGDDIENEDGNINTGTVYKILKFMTELLNAQELAEKVWSDLISSWYWILGGMGSTVLISFLWIILMRFIAGVMIYLSMALALGLLGLGAGYSWLKYSSLAENPDYDGIFDVNPLTDSLSTYLALRDTWLVFFIVSIVVFIVIALILLFLRTRVNIAIELIKESSKAVSCVFSSLFFPVIPFTLQIIVVAYFGVVAAFLASTGEQRYTVSGECGGSGSPESGDSCDPATFIESPDCSCIFYKFTPSDLNLYLQIYNLFALFWGVFFATALGEMVLAGGFASWYWADDKFKDVPTFTLLASLYRAVRYHLGTLAFGSLIIAILRMIRVTLQYIENKIKEKGLDNVFSKIVLCLCKCCFWCLEKFMKFLNRNAYIITASTGSNFCKSAKEAFSLILRNVARVAVLDKVTDFLLFLGKLVVVGTVAVLSFYVFSGGLNDKVPLELASPNLNYYMVPVFIITFSAYMISSSFFSVFGMAVDTLFLCFLIDLEKNENDPHPQYHMSKNLMKILNIKPKSKSN